MRQPIIPREQVARNLAIPMRLLLRYEARGLVHTVSEEGVEGYPPAEIRRVWTVVSCHRDLGINLAGIEAILKLRDQLAEVHARLDRLAGELRAALDDEAEPDA
jgi:MerR family transcriptional regulator/heat shock protein HspR